jgi:hypothetical protein
MNTAITCSYTESANIEVIGADSKEEARIAAISFFREDCDDQGLTLNNGHLNDWPYDDPKPADWVDSYIFEVMDEHVPAGYWEY